MSKVATMRQAWAKASLTDDETVARRALQAGLQVLEESGLKGDGASVDWEHTSFDQFHEVMTSARKAIHRTLRREYHRRGLRTAAWHGMIVDAPDLLLMSAVQAWLAGGNVFSIHPYSATSYAWLAVSTSMAMRHLQDEHNMQRTAALEPSP